MAWSKESRQSRGYGSEWTKVRKRVLERDHGLCRVCSAQGRTTVATQVDHIKPKAEAKRLGWSQTKMDNLQNLQSICHLCHNKKSTEETGRTYKPKVEIGLDGWPVE